MNKKMFTLPDLYAAKGGRREANIKILILTGKFGMGHYSAALSLAQQIREVNQTANVMVKDIFEYAMPEYSDLLYKAFTLMVKHGSLFYNRYYNKMEQKGPDLRPVFLTYFLKKIYKLTVQEQPDAIISTLPLCSQIVSRYKEKTGAAIPLITCITDISSHSEWINSGTDCYLVPSQSIRRKLIEKGVDGEKLYVFGIPVRAEFDRKKQNGVNPKKHILIMGGGLGILPDSADFYEQLNRTRKTEVIVITGKNKDIYHKLYGKYENIRVIGYTNEVYRYMLNADIVISKPGGITLFETIHAETPILVFEPFLQQEINNTGFIVNNGIGLILQKSPKVCMNEIDAIIRNDSLIALMKDNIKKLKEEYDIGMIQKILTHIGYDQEEVYVL